MSLVPADEVTAALVETGAHGPYFRLGAGDHDGAVPLAAYVDRAQRLRHRLDAIGRRLGSTELRVAASSMQYELAERLWSVGVALWCRHDMVLDLHDVRIDPDAATTVELHLAAQRIRSVDPGDRGLSVATALLDQPPLRGWVSGPVDGTIRRRSCCLYYRTSDPRPCPDCPLAGAVVTQRFAGLADGPR